MIKRVIIGSVIMVLVSSMASAADLQLIDREINEIQNIQNEMKATPDLITPDTLYLSYELKTIYYQNTHIIQLLEEIKGALANLREEEE